MRSDIEITINNLKDDIEQRLSKIIVSLGDGLDSEAMLQLCSNHRKIAIGVLIAEADIDGFYQNLYQSARAYVFLLNQDRKDPAIDPYYLCKSRAEPFWDAVAAADMVTAHEIAALATEDMKEGFEDEDDYCYFDFMMSLVEKPDNLSLLEKMLERFKNVLDGGPSVRFNICSALMEHNSDDFKHSLCEFIDERDTDLKERIEYDAISPDDAQTEAVVFIEGIALVKIAKLLNMDVSNEYKLIPGLAFVQPSSGSFPPEDVWKILEE